jgi:Sec-independent protein translocase protein TatA
MATPTSSVLERFRNIEQHFNSTFLHFLLQFRDIFAALPPENSQEVKQKDTLDQAYETWYYRIQDNPKSLDACTRMHDTITPSYKLLMARDPQLLTVKGDLLSAMFDTPGIDTPYLFGLLAEDANPAEDERMTFWENLLNLYRIAALICIYANNTQVKDIIDVILATNPNVAGGNLAHNITSMFKGNKQLQKMIMGLMKSKTNKIGEIFQSLQIVLSTLVDTKPTTTNTSSSAAPDGAWLRTMVSSVLPEFQDWSDRDRDLLLQAIQDNDDMLWGVFKDRVSDGQRQAIETLYGQRSNNNLGNMMRDVNGTMGDFMKAMESNDEKAIEQMMAKTSSLMNLDPNELKRMEQEMKELADEDEKSDDAE